MMPSYLEAAMTNFRDNQGKIREAFEKGISNTPFAKIHETNIAMMRAATDVLMPGASKNGGKAKDSSSSEIEALRQQMSEMQKKLDELSK